MADQRNLSALPLEDPKRPLCPWCKTPGYPDDPYCLYCGRTRAEAEHEAKQRG